MNFSLAIDDDLAEELCKFRTNQQCDVDRVEKTLHYYKGYPIFTKNYFNIYYGDRNIQSNVLQSTSHIDWDSLESVCKSTIYKVILSSQRNVSFPYVSIYDDKIESNFTATFLKNEPRQKALEHLRSLLESARCIFIYDLYLANNWASFISFAQKCFPQKQLSIFYPKEIDSGGNASYHHIKQEQKLTQQQCGQIIQAGQSLWSFKPDRNHQSFSNLHDRYLIIDNKIEVIFTSGIHHLINTDKDFTYIVRQLSHK